jgi:exonuclease VII large subunit
VSEKLKILSPENAFQRGFSITIDPLTGRTIKSIDTIKENQEIKTILKDGEFNSVVKQVSKKSN